MITPRRGLVMLCHHALVLALVGTFCASALLAPGERPTSPDVRAEEPADGLSDELVDEESGVAAPVEPRVRRVPLLAPAAYSTDDSTGPDEEVALSPAEPVEGYGTVGVTWENADVAEDDVRVEVRTEVDGRWSAWQEMDYHPEHGPDPSSPEGRSAAVRAGTEPVVVGDVDHVQVRATTEAGEVEGIALDVVDPGQQEVAAAPELELVAHQRANPVQSPDQNAGQNTPQNSSTDPLDDPRLKPRIHTRAEWGADERLRERSSLSYGAARMGFVHHTVNANDYKKHEVPAIIRGIYAYHTKSRGWSDIGYNFLVDRFGRLWEGRHGGVARSVVGAHTSGYNSRSFSISAIGNFETRRPDDRLVKSIGSLMGWKLSVHGIDARKRSVWVRTGKYFAPVSGHRDAGATACPGRHLYAQLPVITRRAAWLQKRSEIFD